MNLMALFPLTISTIIIIIVADFNVDFSRPGPNCSNLSVFMLSNDLVSVDQMFNIDFTYHKDDYSCFPSPDLILTYSNCANLIDHVSVHDSAENFSDHLSYILSSSFQAFFHFFLTYLFLSIILVSLVTIILLQIPLSTGLESIRMMFLLTVTTFCPPYLNFLFGHP